MSTLTKPSRISVTPGSPAVPGSPGQPSSPGYYTYETYTVKTPHYGWVDVGGGELRYQIIGYITETVQVSTWNPPKPYIPPTPATAAQPPIITELNVGWDAGADTSVRSTGDVSFSFRIPASSVGVAVGLATASPNGDYRKIIHGVYASRGTLSVIEGGVINLLRIPYQSSDAIGVARAGGTVTYSVGGREFRSVSSLASGNVFGAAALYMAGDSVEGALVLPMTASAANTMQPLTGIGYSGSYTYSENTVQWLSTEATGRMLEGIEQSMQPMFTLAADRAAGASVNTTELLTAEATGTQHSAFAQNTMQALTGMGADRVLAMAINGMEPLETSITTGLIQPEFAVAHNAMPYLLGFGVGLTGETGTGSAAMLPMTTIGADRPYGTSENTLQALTTALGEAVPANVAEITGPMGRVVARTRSSAGENEARITGKVGTLTAYTGAVARLTGKSGVLTASGTVTNIATARIAAPFGRLSASCTVSAMASARLFGRAGGLSARTGAQANITFKGSPSITASIKTGAVASGVITGPKSGFGAVDFQATVENFCTATITGPMGYMAANIRAEIVGLVGRVEASCSGAASGVFEAYAVNLLHAGEAPDEVTRYTNYPFTHIVRYQGKYYGANSTGLYLLEGATDNGTAITYEVQTHPDTLGHTGMKTAVSVYLSGRIDPALTAKVVAGEDNPQTYSYTSPRGATAQTHRVRFGRGVKDRYLAFGLSGQGVIELDQIELEISNLKRRI